MAQQERFALLDDDTGGEPPRISWLRHWVRGCWFALLGGTGFLCLRLVAHASSFDSAVPDAPVPWYTILTPFVFGLALVLACFSCLFSASEVAFLSLDKVQLRVMRESGQWSSRLIAKLMRRPGSLLTTILMGNSTVNVLLSVTFAEPLAEALEYSLLLGKAQSYAISIALTTCALLFFCEILPKVIAVHGPVAFAHAAVAPLYVIDVVMSPLRGLAMNMVGFMFKITRLSQVQPAPFLTDDEFITLLSDSEASGVIEEDGRQMIQGILEFDDVTLREIVSPRPDIVAVRESATVGEALDVVREHEYARMPVYREDLDHIVGILYAKDLIPVIEEHTMDRPVSDFIRRPHFVPETMTVADFVTTAQRLRTHIAIVVDEYGGTEGLVTLQDALREVVGDIGEEDDLDKPLFVEVAPDTFQVAGNYPLDEFEERMGIATGDEEHTTIGGFLMAQSDKILESGDELIFNNIRFTIQEVNQKRVTRIHVQHTEESRVEEGGGVS